MKLFTSFLTLCLALALVSEAPAQRIVARRNSTVQINNGVPAGGLVASAQAGGVRRSSAAFVGGPVLTPGHTVYGHAGLQRDFFIQRDFNYGYNRSAVLGLSALYNYGAAASYYIPPAAGLAVYSPPPAATYYSSPPAATYYTPPQAAPTYCLPPQQAPPACVPQMSYVPQVPQQQEEVVTETPIRRTTTTVVEEVTAASRTYRRTLP